MISISARNSTLAGIAAAIGASLCCVAPLVLLALGVGGAWIGSLTRLEPYRPFFIGLMLIFLVWRSGSFIGQPRWPALPERPAPIPARLDVSASCSGSSAC